MGYKASIILNALFTINDYIYMCILLIKLFSDKVNECLQLLNVDCINYFID